eukprot:1137624-Pelagomonas_calceolata.AAC.2
MIPPGCIDSTTQMVCVCVLVCVREGAHHDPTRQFRIHHADSACVCTCVSVKGYKMIPPGSIDSTTQGHTMIPPGSVDSTTQMVRVYLCVSVKGHTMIPPGSIESTVQMVRTHHDPAWQYQIHHADGACMRACALLSGPATVANTLSGPPTVFSGLAFLQLQWSPFNRLCAPNLNAYLCGVLRSGSELLDLQAPEECTHT